MNKIDEFILALPDFKSLLLKTEMFNMNNYFKLWNKMDIHYGEQLYHYLLTLGPKLEIHDIPFWDSLSTTDKSLDMEFKEILCSGYKSEDDLICQ